MPTETEYALMAGNVYQVSRHENNRVPVPKGWEPINGSYEVNSHTGFEALAYKRKDGTEIVISYAGTDPKELPDWFNNLQMGAGVKSEQLLQAAAFYQKIKNDPANEDADITFTGHSMGGGLAGLMGVFFNKHAEVFDPAPFEQSASEFNAKEIYTKVIEGKYPADTDLASFYGIPDFTPESGPPIVIRGEGNITGYITVGEVLSSFLDWIPQLNGNALQLLHHGSEQNHADSLTANDQQDSGVRSASTRVCSAANDGRWRRAG